MYAELIKNLTTNDRKALADMGVPNARVSEWRTGLRLPTRPQMLALAEVKGVNYIELETELIAIETEKEAERKPEMRALLDRLKEHHKTLVKRHRKRARAIGLFYCRHRPRFSKRWMESRRHDKETPHISASSRCR